MFFSCCIILLVDFVWKLNKKAIAVICDRWNPTKLCKTPRIKRKDEYRLCENNRSVNHRSEIPRAGRSPDFVHRRAPLPGFPVTMETAPVYSDGIVPDFHRIPFSSVLSDGHLNATKLLTLFNFQHKNYSMLFTVLQHLRNRRARPIRTDAWYFVFSVVQ